MSQVRRCAGSQLDGDLAHTFTEGRPERFQLAVERMQRWRYSEQRRDTLELIELLDLQSPRV